MQMRQKGNFIINPNTRMPTNELEIKDAHEIGAAIQRVIDQLPHHPQAASLMFIMSGIDTDRKGLIVTHFIAHDEVLVNALVNEALVFKRHDEVLNSIHRIKRIVDTAEANIRHHLNIQSANN